MVTTELDCLPPPVHPLAVAQRLPPGACDAHVHTVGPRERYPLDPGRGYTPQGAPLTAYRGFMAATGVQRAVLVQPSFYGVDNSALLDALHEGGGDFRGVVVPPPSIGDAEIEAMHAAGVRGLRLNLVNPQVLGVEDALRLCRRVQGLGWHLQVQIDLAKVGIEPLQALQRAAGLPLVVDHMGWLHPNLTDHPVLHMLGEGACWIKLSAPYRLSQADAPYADLRPLVDALLRRNPSHLVWGSDWPHTEQRVHMPSTSDVVGWLFDAVPDDHLRRMICVENPARLYQFATERAA